MDVVTLLAGVTVKSQIDIIDRNWTFAPKAVYGYIFEDMNLHEIEVKYLGVDAKGFYARAVLNGIGLDTSRRSNKGRCKSLDLDEAISIMNQDSNPLVNNIGRLLQSLCS